MADREQKLAHQQKEEFQKAGNGIPEPGENPAAAPAGSNLSDLEGAAVESMGPAGEGGPVEEPAKPAIPEGTAKAAEEYEPEKPKLPQRPTVPPPLRAATPAVLSSRLARQERPGGGREERRLRRAPEPVDREALSKDLDTFLAWAAERSWQVFVNPQEKGKKRWTEKGWTVKKAFKGWETEGTKAAELKRLLDLHLADSITAVLADPAATYGQVFGAPEYPHHLYPHQKVLHLVAKADPAVETIRQIREDAKGKGGQPIDEVDQEALRDLAAEIKRNYGEEDIPPSSGEEIEGMGIPEEVDAVGQARDYLQKHSQDPGDQPELLSHVLILAGAEGEFSPEDQTLIKDVFFPYQGREEQAPSQWIWMAFTDHLTNTTRALVEEAGLTNSQVLARLRPFYRIWQVAGQMAKLARVRPRLEIMAALSGMIKELQAADPDQSADKVIEAIAAQLPKVQKREEELPVPRAKLSAEPSREPAPAAEAAFTQRQGELIGRLNKYLRGEATLDGEDYLRLVEELGKLWVQKPDDEKRTAVLGQLKQFADKNSISSTLPDRSAQGQVREVPPEE